MLAGGFYMEHSLTVLTLCKSRSFSPHIVEQTRFRYIRKDTHKPFSYLEGLLEVHLRKFTQQLRLEEAGALQLTDCWVNVMGKGTTHVLHHHGNAIISGTYYVRTPQGCPGIKFEDPRLDRMKHKAIRGLVEMPVQSGDVVLFESWMRHKVSPNMVDEKRVSVSFNYCLPATRIPRARSADRGVLL